MKLFYYAKRIKQLGFLNLLNAVNNRFKKKKYNLKYKTKALQKAAASGWKQVAKKEKIKISLESFLQKLKQKDFIDKILQSNKFKATIPHLDELKEEADNASNYCFEILGKSVCFKNEKINWHQDFKCKSSKNNKLLFYQDIKINTPKNTKLDDYFFDIKVPWELSRFNHIFALAHSTSHPSQTFYNQVNSWIEENPFLLGPNWVCPMDVAIRAINFIWGFNFFKDDKTIPETFWQKLICSLYNHATYLENNWEVSDKPNNHYLSDLLGHFYLCFFFDDLKHFRKAKIKTYKKLLKEFDRQVHPDGTCYEGSTNYHKLITEIFFHFYLLCKTNGISLPNGFEEKLNKMFLFLDNCSDGKNLVQIGDNDSGKVLASIKLFYNEFKPCCATLAPSPYVATEDRCTKGLNSNSHYPNFGLTIIKNSSLHITFRHPTYNKKQPTGHFHQDALSITLSINGIPVLVDPGTYLYTSNPTWRNLMRSYKSHNTFYSVRTQKEREQSLFQLPLSEQKDTAKITHANNKIDIENYYFADKTTRLYRKLTYLKQEKEIQIKDWENTDQPNKKQYAWSFIFHPQIKLIQENKYNWLITCENIKLANFYSTIAFKDVLGFYSPGYGKIERCTKLTCTQEMGGTKTFIKLL